MLDQDKAWRQTAGELCYSIDAELDDAESGIADQDGQVPFRDWQDVGTV
jgi:hypothetical protein